MLSMRVPREKDIQTLTRFLDRHSILYNVQENLDQCMIAEERSLVIGFTSYVYHEEGYRIVQLFIAPDYRKRKIGDGLLRAVLNLMDRRGIQEVFIQVQPECKPFIEYVGLELMDSKKLLYRAELPDFFEQPCRSEKEGGNHHAR